MTRANVVALVVGITAVVILVGLLFFGGRIYPCSAPVGNGGRMICPEALATP